MNARSQRARLATNLRMVLILRITNLKSLGRAQAPGRWIFLAYVSIGFSFILDFNFLIAEEKVIPNKYTMRPANCKKAYTAKVEKLVTLAVKKIKPMRNPGLIGAPWAKAQTKTRRQEMKTKAMK